MSLSNTPGPAQAETEVPVSSPPSPFLTARADWTAHTARRALREAEDRVILTTLIPTPALPRQPLKPPWHLRATTRTCSPARRTPAASPSHTKTASGQGAQRDVGVLLDFARGAGRGVAVVQEVVEVGSVKV